MNTKKETEGGYCSRFFASLSSPLRIRMLKELQFEPMEVYRLVEIMKRERTLISKNLAILSKADLVRVEKRGKHRIYHANEKKVKLVFDLVEEIVCDKCSLRRYCKEKRSIKESCKEC